MSYAQDDLLQLAASRGDLKAMKRALSKGANLKAKDEYGNTILLTAAANGHLPMVQWLVEEKRVSLAEKSNSGYTALLFAASRGHLPVVRCLVEAGANINAKNNNGNTALLFAAMEGHLPVVQCLVEHGANINEKDNNGWTALMEAASRGHLPIVQCLVEHGANINEKANNGCWTALSRAALKGHLPIVQCLVEHGANINENENTSSTALDCAIGGNSGVFDYLVSVGARQSVQQCNAAAAAAAASAAAIASNAASVVQKGNDEELLSAASRGDIDAMKRALSQGANLKAKGANGFTALLLAAWNGHLPVVKWLVEEKGVSLAEKEEDGNTALLQAASSGHFPVVKWLVEEKGVSLAERTNARGSTALLLAAVNGYLPVVRCLVEAGANIDEQDNHGWTALVLARASSHNCRPVLDYLMLKPEIRNMQKAHRLAVERAAEKSRQEREHELEQKRVAAERAAEKSRQEREHELEQKRVAAERAAEKSRQEREHELEQKRVAAERAAEKSRQERERELEQKRIAAEKVAQIQQGERDKKDGFANNLNELTRARKSNSLDMRELNKRYTELEPQALSLKNPDFYVERGNFYYESAQRETNSLRKNVLYDKALLDYNKAMNYDPFIADVPERIEEIEAIKRANKSSVQGGGDPRLFREAAPAVGGAAAEAASPQPKSLPKREDLTPEQLAELELIKERKRREREGKSSSSRPAGQLLNIARNH